MDRGRRLGGEEGAVIVEFALMAPLLVVLMLGIVEYGSILRNETTIAGAVRNSARVAAQYKDDALSDKNTLISLNASLGSAQRITINRVVIYRSTSTDGAPTTNCTTSITPSPTDPRGSTTDDCNVYSAAQVAGATSGGTWWATGPCSTTTWDSFWCPNDRKASLVGAKSPPDYLGVYVSVNYTSITGLIPVTTTYTDFAVNRLEPDV